LGLPIVEVGKFLKGLEKLGKLYTREVKKGKISLKSITQKGSAEEAYFNQNGGQGSTNEVLPEKGCKESGGFSEKKQAT